MTPGARIQAAIDLLWQVESDPAPADRVVAAYVRTRRYMGAKDRRAIVDLVYVALRHRARLDWWLTRAGLGPGEGAARARRVVIAASAMFGPDDPAGTENRFDGSRYGPAPLSVEERAMAEFLAGQRPRHGEQPIHVRTELPPWLLDTLAKVFGPALEAEGAALSREAPVDLRVNTLKKTRSEVAEALSAEGVAAVPTPLSPVGLRLGVRRQVVGGRAFTDGLFEVQDEGSQLVALLTDARPGLAVADFCAGAGGKTLALAAAMGGQGRLVALDINQRRLDQAGRRLRRAGASAVERCRLPDDAWMEANASGFDRVLVDAPCSGSGAWRRNPEARWRLAPAMLAAYRATQDEILRRAATLVAPGGRLVYATCSLLPEENEAPVEFFLAARPDFTGLPARRIWEETLGGDGMPAPDPFRGDALFLTPARHGTDGFFVAILERGAGP